MYVLCTPLARPLACPTSLGSRPAGARRTRHSSCRRRGRPAESVDTSVLGDLAVALDNAPEWTLDQAVGLVFGGLLVAFYFSSQLVDKFVAASQRRALGLCEECGGMYSAASCTQKNCPARRKAEN